MVIEMMHIMLGSNWSLVWILDKRNLPLLIHCNSGKVGNEFENSCIAPHRVCCRLYSTGRNCMCPSMCSYKDGRCLRFFGNIGSTQSPNLVLWTNSSLSCLILQRCIQIAAICLIGQVSMSSCTMLLFLTNTKRNLHLPQTVA